MTDLAKVTVACCPISLACLPQELRRGAPFSNKINNHRAWHSVFHTAEAGLWAGEFPTHTPLEVQNWILTKMRSKQQSGSTDWHVRGTRIDKHLCLLLLLILHYLYYSGPWVCEGNGNLIKRLPESMKTMQFTGLPWGSAPQGISISAPFPWQDSAPSPRCSVAAGKGQTAPPGRERRMQTEEDLFV